MIKITQELPEINFSITIQDMRRSLVKGLEIEDLSVYDSCEDECIELMRTVREYIRGRIVNKILHSSQGVLDELSSAIFDAVQKDYDFTVDITDRLYGTTTGTIIFIVLREMPNANVK